MGARLRVLHVISGLGTGGAERSLAEMLPLLSDAGVTSSIVCLAEKPKGVHAQVVQAGFPVTVVGTSRLAAPVRIRRTISEWKPDIVHTTIFDADVLGRIASVARPCKLVTSLVNTTYDGVRIADSGVNRTKLAAAKAVDRFTALRFTDHFHAISDAVKDSAVTHLGIAPDRVTVVERGRDLGRLGNPSPERRKAVRRALGLPLDAEVVLNVGRQEPQKGQSDLLDAVAKLATARPRLVMLQVGREGKASRDLHRIATNSGLAPRTRFLGHRDDVGDLLAAADVFAFPSIYEGLGGSVLEAMAMRVPIVVTDVPALVDVVEAGRGATVVPVCDPSALAQAIGDLLDHPEEAALLAEQARQIFFNRFTLERSVNGMVELYHNVAAGGMR